MYSKPLIYGLTAYECLKHHIQPDKLNDSINGLLERLPDDRPSAPCTGNILCERISRRHKQGCMGKTEPFTAYAKGLQ